MRKTILLLLLIPMSQVLAHPGIGLIYDGGEKIYYTDLSQIWVVNTNTGEKAVAVPDVHSHELFIDDDKSLFGEHYAYDEATGEFYYQIWELKESGAFKWVSPRTAGFNQEFSYLRNLEGKQYFLDSSNPSIRVKHVDGLIQEISIDASQCSWGFITESDELLVTCDQSVFKIEDNKAEFFAKNVSKSRIPYTFLTNHDLYGTWTDSSNIVHVADYAGQRVIALDEGRAHTVYHSSILWSPVNGLFTADGTLWLLEANWFNQVRLSPIDPKQLDESSRVRTWFYLSLYFLIAVLIYYAIPPGLRNQLQQDVRGKLTELRGHHKS